jgi:hypothetical protein
MAVPAGAKVVASFQNPAGGSRLVVEQDVWPQSPTVDLQSPPLTCVRRDKTYDFAIDLVDANGSVLQTLKSTILSTEDQNVLPPGPLTLGSGYAPNPDVLDANGNVKPNDALKDCPP